MSQQDLDKAYISPIDKFLHQFDKTHQKSASQQVEIKKHRRIAQLRDQVKVMAEQDPVWEDF